MTEITLQVFLVLVQTLHCKPAGKPESPPICITQTAEIFPMPEINTCLIIGNSVNSSGKLPKNTIATCHVVEIPKEEQAPKLKGLTT